MAAADGPRNSLSLYRSDFPLALENIGQPSLQKCRWHNLVLPAACHILLLEDDPAVAQLVVTALNHAGFTNVRTSSSIAGARQCWHAQVGKFDLFVTDFSLPDGCAPNFIRELLRYKPDLRVILMTGFSEESLDLEDGLSHHLKVLQKPFPPSDLVEAAAAALNVTSAVSE